MSNPPWYSLYLPVTEAQPVVEALRSLLTAEGYAAYDPFPGGTGTPPGLKETLRQFAAPVQDGWLRLLGQPAERLLPNLSTAVAVPILYAWLDEQSGGFALFSSGSRREDAAAFEPYLHPDHSPDELRSAFEGKLKVAVLDGDSSAAEAGTLPPELHNFAQQQGVDDKQANKVFERLSASVFGKLGKSGEGSKEEMAQARAVFTGGAQDPWNSLNGQRVRAIASVLRLPGNWRLPTFETVRDAYQVHRLRERSPRMLLMPGDKEAMQAVPDGLSYIPIYVGK